MTLSLAQRLDMLFHALHPAHEPEPTPEIVAEALREHGIAISAQELIALRTGDSTDPPPALLTALADHFSQAAWYPTDPGDAERVIDAHIQLELLRALREAGVHRVRLRGRPSTTDREALIQSLRCRDNSREDEQPV